MGILEAILLGIIQGIAEFLPISSSGHLAIFQKLFGMDQVGISFDVFLHIGTLIAVFIVFWKDILRLFVDGVGIVADSCVNVYRFFRSKNKKEPVEYIRVIRTAYRKFALLVNCVNYTNRNYWISWKGISKQRKWYAYYSGHMLACYSSFTFYIRSDAWRTEDTKEYKLF